MRSLQPSALSCWKDPDIWIIWSPWLPPCGRTPRQVQLGRDPEHIGGIMYPCWSGVASGSPRRSRGHQGFFPPQPAFIMTRTQISDEKWNDGPNIHVEEMIDSSEFLSVEGRGFSVQGQAYVNSFVRSKLKWRQVTLKPSYCHCIFLSVPLTLSLFLSSGSTRLYSFHIQSHGSIDKHYLCIPLFFFCPPPSSTDRVFAFCLGLLCAATAGQRRCKTAPEGECTQVFKVFPCKFRVPALSTEPISETVVKEGLHCQGPGARVKTRSVLWSLVPLRYGQQPSTLMFSSPIPQRRLDRGTQSIFLLSNVGFEFLDISGSTYW